MTRMRNPPHPGEVLRDGVFAETGITVTELAKRLGVTRVALSRVLNGKAATSAVMAVRLALALGGNAESWLHMQASVAELPEVRNFGPATAITKSAWAVGFSE